MSALPAVDLPSPRRDRILVVDDNPAIHEDFRKILAPTWASGQALAEAAAGFLGTKPRVSAPPCYELDTALRGEDGLSLLKSAWGSGRPYAMAFVDMRMPNGWNGLQTIEQLWRVQADLPVVLCTAFSDFSWEEIRAELGRSDRFLILKKPFDHIEVQQMVDAMLMRRLLETRTCWTDLCIARVSEAVLVLQATSLEGADHDLKIVFVNKAFERLLAYQSAQVLGQPMSMLCDGPAGLSWAQALQAGLVQADGGARPWRLRAADGQWVQACFELLPVQGPHGAADHWVCLQRPLAPSPVSLPT
jgi:CheY-like chemotaxis protein